MSQQQDRIELQDLMLRYAAAVDDRDYQRYAACFADDVEVIGFGQQSFGNKEGWLNYVWTALENYGETQHMLGPQLVSFEADYADTRNDVQAFHSLKGENAGQFILWATYQTRMKKIQGEWKIIRHELIVRGTKNQ